MANTFELISAYTASGSVASITFSSIPQTFTDLKLVFSLRRDAAGNDITLNINGSSASLSSRMVRGSGTAADSASYSLLYSIATRSTYTANTFGNGEIYIPNYTSTTTYKSLSSDAVTENNGTESYQFSFAGLYSSNTAITSLTLLQASGNFVTNSTAYLYGIKNS